MIAWLACETGIAPSVLMQESDRMLFTMTRYLSWRSMQYTKAVKS